MQEHFNASFAAQGGPVFDGPTIPVELITDITSGPMTIMYLHDRATWAVVGSQGEVYVESPDPSELTPWLSEYLDALAKEESDRYYDGLQR